MCLAVDSDGEKIAKEMEVEEKYQKVQAVVFLSEFQIQLFCKEPHLVSQEQQLYCMSCSC